MSSQKAGTSYADNDDNDPGGWYSRLKSSREYSVIKKIAEILQDNREDDETKQELSQINQQDSFPILKRVLNIIFVTTGVSLLLAVVSVIVYSKVTKDAFSTFLEDEIADTTQTEAMDFQPTNRPQNGDHFTDDSSKNDDALPTGQHSVKCRTVPMVFDSDGQMQMGKICFKSNSIPSHQNL